MIILFAYSVIQTLYGVEASDQKVEIVVEDADYISTNNMETPSVLLSIIKELTPIIIVEYVDFVGEFVLQGSSDLNQLATMVESRITIEYAEATTLVDLQRPPFLPPLIMNLKAFQADASYPQPGIVVISYDVIDARQFVTVKFQYWDGSRWVDCATITGGVVHIGSNIGIWNAKADINNYYTANMKIRIIVDNGETISSSETSTFILDTEDPPSPGILSPLNGAFIKEGTLTLDWSDVSDPSGVKYDLEIDDDPEFGSPLLVKNWLNKSDYTITSKEALKDGVYYWRVRAVDNVGNRGNWVSSRFTIDTTPPKADAGSDRTVDEDTPIILDASSSTDENGIINYTWILPDGNILNGMTTTYVFENPGTYTITLMVTDPAGNSARDEVIIRVLDKTKPTARATYTIISHLVTWTVNFDASASTDNVGITEYEWNFGDGTTARGQVVSHTYLTARIYNVTLTVRDAAGNIDTKYITIDITLSPPYWHTPLLILIITFGVITTLIVSLRKIKQIKE
jgi:chitodextrinase